MADLEGRPLLLGELDADGVEGAGVGHLEAAVVGFVLRGRDGNQGFSPGSTSY
jgi:hypothetical protein